MKMNEENASTIYIDLVRLVKDYPELKGRLNELAEDIEDTLGAAITEKSDETGGYMGISGVDFDELAEFFESYYLIYDIETYINDNLVDIDDSMNEDDEFDFPAYEDVEYDKDEELNDVECNDDFDECVENIDDEEFECYESKKSSKMISLTEALKMKKNNVSVKDIVKSAINENVLTESIIKNAMNKVNTNNEVVNESEKNVVNSDDTMNENSLKSAKEQKYDMLKELLGDEKYNLVLKAVNERRNTLYTKKTINGKNITEYSSKELYEMLRNLNKQIKTTVLNESNSVNIDNKKHLMEILDEELTYRLTFKLLMKKLNEAEEESNPLEPLPVDPIPTGDESEKNEDVKSEENEETNSDNDSKESEESEDPEDDEIVELSRVVITVADKEAAEELVDTLVEAGIDKEDLTIDDGSDDEESEGSDDEESEDTADDSESFDNADDTTNSEEKTESIHYKNFKKLLEDDNTESEDTVDPEDNSSDETSEDDTDEENDNSVKVILLNTDKIEILANILDDVYGIPRDEFNQMIDGEIVSDSDEEDSVENSNEDSNEESENNKESEENNDENDKPSTNGDDAIDNMDLDKLFGNN